MMLFVKGVVFFVGLTAVAFVCCMLMTPSLLLLPIHSRRVIALRRGYVSLISFLFFNFAAGMLMYVCGCRVRVYCESRDILRDAANGAVVICNHRTRVDWMFCGWCYGALTVMNANLIVILKQSLRSVPVYGWCMQQLMYIFLSRSRDADLPHISRMLDYLLQGRACTQPPSVLLFPEGTDLSDSMRARSNAFAKERGLPEHSYVLYPKSAGLAACLGVLRNSAAGRAYALHDITIAYRDHTKGVRTSESLLLRGFFPPEVHLVVRRHELQSLPGDDSGLTQWLYKTFNQKEELLRNFYEGDSREGWPPELSTDASSIYTCMALSALCVGLFIALSMFSVVFKWAVTIAIIIYVAAHAGKGFDAIELLLHHDMVVKKQS